MMDSATAFIDPRLGMGEVEPRGRPALNVVAGFAIFAEDSSMEGGVLMACDASCGKPFVGSVGMTLTAFDSGMSACEWEVGTTVIKVGVLPIGGVVAGLALPSIRTIVLIIAVMAGITIRRGSFKDVTNVALLTCSFGVFPIQFEGGEVVIKICFLPGSGDMTRLTICSISSIMSVVLRMAGVTILRQRLQICDRTRIKMTLGACGFQVPTLEPEDEIIVIKFSEAVDTIMTGEAI